ncbi:MAG TPA: hypothetical protein VGG51_08985 [Candidatus Cybelea sp.]
MRYGVELVNGAPGSGEVEAAWADDDGLRLCARDLRPLQALRVRTRIRQDRLAAGEFDDAGNPVPGAHRRIDPLQGERPRTMRTALRFNPERGSARAQRFEQRFGFRRMARHLAQKRNRCKHVVERRWLERDDTRPAPLRVRGTQLFRRAHDDFVRDGTDFAELLGNDEVGCETLEQRRIEVIEARAGVNRGAHVAIDRPGIAQLRSGRGR